MATGRRVRNLARRRSRPYIKNFSYLIDHTWMGGRAVEGTGLENPFTRSVQYSPIPNSPEIRAFLASDMAQMSVSSI